MLLAGVLALFQKKGPLSIPLSDTSVRQVKPSETSIEYTDPTGFSFSYPDNLSIAKNEAEDPNSYADLQLYSKDVSGSISLKIADTKLKTLDDWLKESKVSSDSATEKKLGELKAIESRVSDRLMLAAIDKGVLFRIEVPLIEEGFWMRVYNKLLTDFAFVSPVSNDTQGVSDSSDDVTFEAEEVVE